MDFDKLTLIVLDNQQQLIRASKSGLFLPPILGIIDAWKAGVDLFATLKTQVVLGSSSDGLFANDNGEN